MPGPVVSVTMCVHNGSRYLAEAVESVFTQTFQDFELIIVDDGSTDGGVDAVAREFRDDRLHIVRQRQQTLRVARPVAVRHARGKYIAFLDHDDVWLPHKLARQVAAGEASPDTALIFSDCLIIDQSGNIIGRLSDQFDFHSVDLSGFRGHLELLRRGNFVAYPTALARAAAVRALGGFNHSYQYVSDYDLWLRLARRRGLRFIEEPLAKYRVHDTQFTQRNSHITLAEHRALLTPMMNSSTYPRVVRIAIGDNLVGQHRVAASLLFKQRRYRLAAGAAFGMWRYPGRICDSWRHQASTTKFGSLLETGVAAYYRVRDWQRRGAAFASRARRLSRAPRRLARILRGQEPLVRKRAPKTPPPPIPTQVWIDGSSLGKEQTGYFNLLSELVRGLVHHQSTPCEVHVMAQRQGREALLSRLGQDGSGIRFHSIGWRTMHWSQVDALVTGRRAQLLVLLIANGMIALGLGRADIRWEIAGGFVLAGQSLVLLDELIGQYREFVGRPRHRYAARLIRYLWRRLPAPRWRAPAANTVEVFFWRGRFRWRDSHRIAIVQDLTTRILPEMHTHGNVSEFEEFLGYAQRHAHTIATVSEHSRQDIIELVGVCPQSVSVLRMPVHPQYRRPQFDRSVLTGHGLDSPYVLCVGTLEPRKNLRRLVKAFELLKDEEAMRGVNLVLIGPPGWDSTLRDFLLESDAAPRVRILGFVPLDHLPSLYHFASAVITPSVYEGFGIPVLEAMCSSALVLASRVSSLPEVLGHDGVLFDPYDTQAIARALLAVLNLSAPDAASYRRRCLERASAHLARLDAEGPLPGLSTKALLIQT